MLPVLVALAAFGGGVWLLVESVETLVRGLSAWAAAAGLSGIVLAAIVLGFDFEATAAGVASALNGLPAVALGTSIGGAIFLVTIGLGIAALAAPFTLRTPRRMLAGAIAAALAPLVLVQDGDLSRLDGAVLVACFPPLVAITLSARRDRDPGERVERPPWLPLRVAAGLAGLLVGAELLAYGARTLVDELGISETLFGLVVVAAAVSFEEVILELLPAHRGRPDLSVGNALGTLVFLTTASLGVIALVRPLAVPDDVRTYHAPALVVTVALLTLALWRGRLGRAEGALLAAAYAVYVVGAIAVE